MSDITVVQEAIGIKFVNKTSKYPKFSSGSVKLVDDTWLTVAKNVSIDTFVAGHNYDVEIETNEKGYRTITDVTPVVEKESPRNDAIRPSPSKPRDFDAEARGKTRCVQFEAALMSPALAGLQFNDIDEYLELVRKAADAGVAYTFEGK